MLQHDVCFVNSSLRFIPHLPWPNSWNEGGFLSSVGSMYANSSVKRNDQCFVYIYLKLFFLFCNGKWMKSFCALKVLIVSASCFNGRRVRPVAEREQLYLRLHRRPGNFMLYLRTFHVLCLPCQTSFQPLIRWNGKRMTAALMSVISFWNRFRNGKMPGPAVTTRRSEIRSVSSWPQRCLSGERGSICLSRWWI